MKPNGIGWYAGGFACVAMAVLVFLWRFTTPLGIPVSTAALIVFPVAFLGLMAAALFAYRGGRLVLAATTWLLTVVALSGMPVWVPDYVATSAAIGLAALGVFRYV